MKIAFVCNEYPPAVGGGIGVFVQLLGGLLTNAGHDITIVGLGPKSETRHDASVRVVTLAETRLRGWSWWWDRRRVHRWLADPREHLDLVEVPDYWGMLPWRFPAAPVVVRLHLTETAIAQRVGQRVRRTVGWCERRTLDHQRPWLGVSRFAVEDTRRVFGNPTAAADVIYTPVIAPPESVGVAPSLPRKFVLFVGTVGARKGAFTLAKAAREFLPRHPDVDLVYVGRLETSDGVPADVHLRRTVGETLAARVHCLGRLSDHADVWACLRRASAFVFPSTQEFFGRVIAEAMLAGCPVIVGRGCASEELVEHERDGLLVDPTDPAAIAAAVDRVLTHPEWAAALARHGAERMRTQFSPDRLVPENIAYFERTIAAWRARHART